MAVIFGGMITAFIILLAKLPSGAFAMAGTMGKMQAVDFSPDPSRRYTFWSGLLGGLFLSLSYFGTDQSQVQRYLGGASAREGRLGLMFNAVMKIPMQFFIVLIGALLFVFFQFQPDTPVFFNRAEWARYAEGSQGAKLHAIEEKHVQLRTIAREKARAWLEAREGENGAAKAKASAEMIAAQQLVDETRKEAKEALLAADPKAKVKDSDYVFITFILSQLPHGLIGLLLAVMFASALSSKAAELNALAATSTIDLWRHYRPIAAEDESRNVRVAKWFTALWGSAAIGFALFASFAENLIEALNIIASIFYGVVLGIFLVAFFFKKVTGTPVFVAAIVSQTLVIVMYFSLPIGYLWYNIIGCGACVIFSIILQALIKSPEAAEAPPATAA
jgi:Na+/proline symporter